MEANTAVALLGAAQGAAGEVVKEMAETLASYGIEPLKYEGVMTEALACTPTIVNCDLTSLKRAVRQCCMQGMIPDGRQGVIVPFKDNRANKTLATFMPMKLGMQMAIHETTGGIIKSGVVREQDDFTYEEGIETVFKHRPVPSAREG